MLLLLRGLRALLAWTDFVLFTGLMWLLACLPLAWTRGFYPGWFGAWSRCFVRALNVDLRLHQKHVRALPERYILIANHPSAFEDIGVPALFPVVSLAKSQVKDWWVVGRISQAAGTLYVDRESRASRRQSIDTMAQALRAGKNICLYPEGGCKGRRLFSLFRHGAFELSLQTGVPIVPLFIHYEAQQDFEWQPPYTLLDKIRHFVTTRNNRANYYVYDAIDPATFADKESYNRHVYQLYLGWQAQYLE